MIPSIGRIIHVCIGIEDGTPVLRPAIITRVISTDTVNAYVFYDTAAEAAAHGAGSFATQGILMGQGIGCWQWPGRV